jgi:hypothetical protein
VGGVIDEPVVGRLAHRGEDEVAAPVDGVGEALVAGAVRVGLRIRVVAVAGEHDPGPRLQVLEVRAPPQQPGRQQDQPHQRPADHGRGGEEKGRRLPPPQRADEPAERQRRDRQRRRHLDRRRQGEQHAAEEARTRRRSREREPQAEQQRIEDRQPRLAPLQRVEDGKESGEQRERQKSPWHRVTARVPGQPSQLVNTAPRQQQAHEVPDRRLPRGGPRRQGREQQGEERRVDVVPAADVGDGVRIAAVVKRGAGLRVDRQVGVVFLRALGIDARAPPHVIEPARQQHRQEQGEQRPPSRTERPRQPPHASSAAGSGARAARDEAGT